MIGLRSRSAAAALALLWAGVLWELCTTTKVHVSGRWIGMRWLTNLTHAPLFGVLAALVALAIVPGRVPGPDAEARPARAAFAAAAALAVAYGVGIEWRQAYIPGRTASGFDVITDAVGAFGVPWALATGALWSRRAAVVFLVASVAAALATARW